jgi:hypothetical protein
MRNDFSSFASEMRKEISARSKTNWSPIISGIAVVVAILGGLITLGAQGPLSQLTRVENASMKAQDQFTDVERRMLDKVNDVEREGYKRVDAEKDLAVLGKIVSEVREEVHSHEKIIGHPALAERVEGIHRMVDLINDHLKTLEARVDAQSGLASKIDSIQHDIEQLRTEILETRKKP